MALRSGPLLIQKDLGYLRLAGIQDRATLPPMEKTFADVHAAIGAGTINQAEITAWLIAAVREFHQINGPGYPLPETLEFGRRLMDVRDHWMSEKRSITPKPI